MMIISEIENSDHTLAGRTRRGSDFHKRTTRTHRSGTSETDLSGRFCRRLSTNRNVLVAKSMWATNQYGRLSTA